MARARPQVALLWALLGRTGAQLHNPCLDASSPVSKMPFCDTTLPVDTRVKDLVSRMSLKEKISNLQNTAGAIPSLNIPAYDWWSEGTGGISRTNENQKKPYATSFAYPITTAMSFNRSLWHATAGRIGTEARAAMNAGLAYSTFWTPVVNLAREPRWGRNIEAPGEDPYLSSQYAIHFTRGFQESPKDPRYLLASACCKHYVANEMEHATVAGVTWTRHNFDANVSMQDLVDSYMAPFQACVEQGRASGLMCSYNAVNGVPTCANNWLLQEVARDTWGFDGYVSSDCDADDDVFNQHHYTKEPEQTVQAVLRAGTDSDCGGFVPKYAEVALQKGLISEKDLDDRLHMLFRVRMRLSHFDPLGPLNEIPMTEVCSEASKATGRQGVTQSAALLKNSDKALPLDASSVKSVAVIGPNAQLGKAMADYYSPPVPCDGDFFTLAHSVQQYVSQTSVVAGLPSVSSSNTSGVAEAVQAAMKAEVVVLGLGTDLTMAREEQDATSIRLPKGQQELAEAVLAAATRPVIVVMLTATPLDISELLANPKVGAILHVGQPGEQVIGVGDVLFGKVVPAGRLIQTIYPASYGDAVSIFDFNMRPGPSAWPRPDCDPSTQHPCPLGTNPGRTHRFYTGEAVLPFGYGLSYTSFSYEVIAAPSELSLAPLAQLLGRARRGFVSSAATEEAGAAATYTVRVANTGDVDADDAVLGFLVPPNAGKDGVPLQLLFGFERVHVPAGKSVTVNLYPAWTDFSQVDAAGNRQVAPGRYAVRFGVREAHAAGMGLAEHALSTSLGELVI